MVCHTIVLDVIANTCTSREVIEISQNDSDAHQILIKLVSGNKFYSISDKCTAEISFYDSFDQEIFVSTGVKIANAYRGYVSYIVGSRLTKDYGRYVGCLKLYNEFHDVQLSAKFIVSVVKSPGNSPDCECKDQTEVVITRSFYKDLLKHLHDTRVHLTDEDRDLLDYIADNRTTIITYDNLGQALSEDPEIRSILEEIVTEVAKSAVDEEVLGGISRRVGSCEESLTWAILS